MMQIRFRLIQVLSVKCINKLLRVLKLIVIYVISNIILEIIVLFNSVLKTVIDINIVRVYDLIYYSFILIINYYRSKRSVDLLRKRVYNSSLKMHNIKY